MDIILKAVHENDCPDSGSGAMDPDDFCSTWRIKFPVPVCDSQLCACVRVCVRLQRRISFIHGCVLAGRWLPAGRTQLLSYTVQQDLCILSTF